MGSLIFDSGTKVIITPEGYIQVLYEEEGDITYLVSTMAAEEYEAQSHEGLDYVELLEMMCKEVLNAENILM